MLKEFEFFHGVVFARLIHGENAPVIINSYPTSDNASYIINGKAGIYIKYSAKRMSPWHFSFQREHKDEILGMENKLGEVYVLFVCNDDGIACLNFSELKSVLDVQQNGIGWISISRGPREEYKVNGSGGKLSFKISNNEFPSKVLKLIEK